MAFTSIRKRAFGGKPGMGRPEFPPESIELLFNTIGIRVKVGRQLVADAKYAFGMKADFLFDSETRRFAIKFGDEGVLTKESGSEHKKDVISYGGRAVIFTVNVPNDNLEMMFPKVDGGVIYRSAGNDIKLEDGLLTFVVIPGDPEPEKIRKVHIPPPVVLTGGRPTNAQIKARKARERAIAKAKSLGQAVVDAPPKSAPPPVVLLESVGTTDIGEPVAAPPPAETIIKPLPQAPPSV